MARPATITDAQILEAARAAFLEEGYGARTAEIARRAGVSEGTIFKRFETKEALFCAALDIPFPPNWYQQAETLVGAGTLRDNLVTLCIGILEQLKTVLPRVITRMGTGMPPPPHTMVRPEGSQILPFHEMPEPPPVRDARILTQYLNREIALGRLKADADIVAQMLLGATFHFMLGQHVARREPDENELKLHAEGIVETIWNGIAPTEEH